MCLRVKNKINYDIFVNSSNSINFSSSIDYLKVPVMDFTDTIKYNEISEISINSIEFSNLDYIDQVTHVIMFSKKPLIPF